ncbi:MaoC family dehydratase N-terminal domain-containing protein [Enhydrobacter sp.]|jgi:3-methylfumaryl-CoA hydratase|uniref:FAS1-like dehydratase domain-containing protein n=1 Tax=Enhydrobacter sp. TaxID=1894999 RepID=UPI00261AAF1E|nr:MaoC family dehydratase N-terminal domain-containing protein [Enhydrobacter sp.]WIM12425.1 MAG: MaoC family dehydratase N-terminal domain-containing protein [Enhydrobacter sp.]
MSLENLRDWVGRTQTAEDAITGWPVRALAATFDEKDPPPREGDPLPPLWHWLFFLEAVPQSRIGPDGHAERGDFLPPVPLPRRMWAGSRFTFDGTPLTIGDRAARRSEIRSIEPKTGSTGTMVFVTVRHSVSGPRGHSFVEEHDIVYREAPKAGEKPRQPKPAPTGATWSKSLTPDPVLLFRYSALTFNGHRIHYDQPYVTGTEGYPGLIVHGPLLGMLQMELARRSNVGRVPASFEFRALSPIFAGAPLTVGARREDDGSVTTWIANDKGGLAQQGKADFR